MKKITVLIAILFFATISCKDEIIPKPKNLIEKDKMVDIIYDLAILEATKSKNSSVQSYLTPTEFLKRKYKVDSLTFAKSTQYYASDINEYKKMYDEVKNRLISNKAKLSGKKKTETSVSVKEDGIVK